MATEVAAAAIAIFARPDEDTLAGIKAEVEELSAAFPLYAPKRARAASDGARKVRVASPVGAHR